ncbi:MAG: glycosyltransferase [Chitinophagales bacterium]
MAYDFPPYVSVGALRPYSWYKHLKEFDIFPIVITRQWNNINISSTDYISKSKTTNSEIEINENGIIIKTPYKPNLSNRILLKHGEKKFKLIRKTITAFYELIQFILPFGTKYQIYKEAERYIKNKPVDLIIATGDPFILFKYATDLSTKYRIPVITDYRDLWTQDISMKNQTILRNWFRMFEKKILKKTTYNLTVSLFLKNKLKTYAKKNRIKVITNGFDEESIKKIKNITQNSKVLTIGFMGTLYPWHPFESFLEVVSNFDAKESKIININLYGINDKSKYLNLLIEKYQHLSKNIKIYPKMENAKVLKELSKSNVLLLFNDYSFLGTKIFDYIGLERLILFCYSKDENSEKLKKRYFKIKGENEKLQEETILKTNSGIIVENQLHLQKTLKDLILEFEDNGKIQCNSRNTELYSRKIQVKKLAALIKSLV